MNAANKKCVLELSVLSLLNRSDSSGYDVSEHLIKYIPIAGGEVYPILRKLKNEGLLKTYMRDEGGEPPRRYYSITQLGQDGFFAKKEEYLRFAKSIEKILEGSDYDKN